MPSRKSPAVVMISTGKVKLAGHGDAKIKVSGGYDLNANYHASPPNITPGQTLIGHVVSLAPATGAQFSVLPPENATGNFTKIVQRVPVRIRLDPGQPGLERLRPGLSTTVEVRLKGQ